MTFTYVLTESSGYSMSEISAFLFIFSVHGQIVFSLERALGTSNIRNTAFDLHVLFPGCGTKKLYS